MTAAAVKKRERLAPETRRAQILDRAARMVLEEGLSVVSMERLGRECGISKGLVYNYFPSRDHLLAALLRREQEELGDRGMAAALQAASYPELIRQTTRIYLEHVAERGVLTQALLADPSVAQLMQDADRADRERTFRFFVKQTRKTFALPLVQTIAAVEMLMAVTDRAGRLVSGGELDVDTAEEMTVELILGGLEQLAARFGRT
jgi:AcrR family transcriptional regulator